MGADPGEAELSQAASAVATGREWRDLSNEKRTEKDMIGENDDWMDGPCLPDSSDRATTRQ